MNKETLRDFSGRIIGYIETDSQGNKIGRDFSGWIVGRYNKSLNTTTDFYGRIVSRGDTLSGLIYSSKK